MSGPDVPEAVTYREIQEILRTFRDSGWTGMTVHLHGMRITVGKDGPPRGPAGPVGAVAGDRSGDRQTGPHQGGSSPRTGPDGRSSVSAGSQPTASPATAVTSAVGAPGAATVAPAPPAPTEDQQPGPVRGGSSPGSGPDRRSPTAGGAGPDEDRRPGPDEGRISPGSGLDRRSSAAGAAVGSATGDADPSGCVDVRSPAVGAFWVAPSPGQPPFVRVGQSVAADEQLAIVEVMKLMNPVVAPVAGTVAAVCAADADLVEYDQVLFRIRPGDG